MLALAVLPAENVGRGNQNAEAYGEQIRKNSDSHLFFLQYFAQMLNRLIQHPHAVLQESFCLIFLLATVELRPIHSARETRTALFFSIRRPDCARRLPSQIPRDVIGRKYRLLCLNS